MTQTRTRPEQNGSATGRLGSGIGTGATAGGAIGVYELAVYYGLEAVPAAGVAMLAGLLAGVLAQWARDVLAWKKEHQGDGPPSFGVLLLRVFAALGCIAMIAWLPACAARAWPPQMALGQSETWTCGLYIDTRTLPDGTVEEGVCEDYQDTLGGKLSPQGANAVRLIPDLARAAAAAAFNLNIPAPPPPPAAEPEPRP